MRNRPARTQQFETFSDNAKDPKNIIKRKKDDLAAVAGPP